MKPDVDRFLEVATVYLMGQLAPSISVTYEQSNVNVLAVMLMAVREEFDRAAARRIEENRALRRLFAEAAPVVNNRELRSRLMEAASGADAQLLVSDLERGNAMLRGLLIELHTHVESLDSPESRRVEAAIWCELAASTERRKLAMGPV